MELWLTRFYTGMVWLLCFLNSVCYAENRPDTLPLDDLRRFTSVIEHIRNYYVDSKEDAALFNYAIRGLLAGLDPHSAFLEPHDYHDIQESTAGQFGGLGMEVSSEQDMIRVIAPIDDTPAQRGGVQAGDLIIRINETPIKGLGLREAVEMMRGEIGTSVSLLIVREGEANPINITLVREAIEVASVKSRMLDPHIAYVRITQFQNNTVSELRDQIKQLIEESKSQKLSGLVLDLRNNPGGLLDAAVGVSDTFLDRRTLSHEGLIVYTRGRLEASNIRSFATSGDLLNQAPLVVLINEGSASASEIVAGSLQDHHRALILGTTSFGKGSVQTILPLDHDFGLKLTTALYYTPAGRSIQASGIIPDLYIPLVKLPENTTHRHWSVIKERDLQGHLSQQEPDLTHQTDSEKAESDLQTDSQLLEAYRIVKALTLHAPQVQ